MHRHGVISSMQLCDKTKNKVQNSGDSMLLFVQENEDYEYMYTFVYIFKEKQYNRKINKLIKIYSGREGPG